MSFQNAHPALRAALTGRGYTEPTDVQRAVMDAGDTDQPRDLLVSAQTGSGKTVAFGLAAAASLLGDADRMPPAGPPMMLAIAPTRELALQVQGELAWLYALTGARIASCVGGMDPRRERQELAAGCHIVVGTPGRLRDHIERRQLDLSALRIAVLDEADEMLDLGFREDLEFILQQMPADRRTLLFSATIAKDIAALARTYQRDALRIDTVRRHEPHADIEYRAMRIAPGEMQHAAVNVLRYYEPPGALVFCATRDAVRHMHAGLLERGFAAVALSGELSQAERSRALTQLRDGRARVCIATDVAARGLDLPSLDLVIHAELPGSREALLHRSGRTGRAGRKGTCVLLVPPDRYRRALSLFGAAGIAVQWDQVPTADAVRTRDDERLLASPMWAEPAEEEAGIAAQLLARQPAAELVAALLRAARAKLPAAEDVTEQATQPAPFKPRPDGRPDRNRDRGPRPERTPFPTDTVRFRIAVGRHDKADPKWVLPLICRAGGVTRDAIGRIEIGDRDSLFEVAEVMAEAFRMGISVQAGGEPRISEVGVARGRPDKAPQVARAKAKFASASSRKRARPG